MYMNKLFKLLKTCGYRTLAHMVYVLVGATLLTTPLECMQKICPHQTQTLYTTRHNAVIGKQRHSLARLLDVNEHYQDSDTELLSRWLCRVLVDIKPSDIPLAHCELCYSKDSVCGPEFEDIVRSVRKKLRSGEIMPLHHTIIDEIAPILKDRNITQQLIALFRIHRINEGQNLAITATPSLNRVMAYQNYIHAVISIVLVVAMVTYSTTPRLIMTTCCVFCVFICNLFITCQECFRCCSQDSRKTAQQKVINHFLQEIRCTLRPNHQDDSFKDTVRSRGCDTHFAFNA